ncbi:hypothetical protein GW17_00046491 [Ensete ventricosum]|nr:hypothetical protein GW17_00046491 [Ensete ventricosum]
MDEVARAIKADAMAKPSFSYCCLALSCVSEINTLFTRLPTLCFMQALSSPYLGSRSRSTRQSDDDGGGDEDEDEAKDLRSRGLCLVPLSSTLHVGNDNGADFWAPNLGMGFQ